MATLADSLVSSSARKLPVRVRPDLSARRHRYHGRSYWVVKDPVGLNYFRFQEEEFAILRMLDGETSLDEIKQQFEAEFPPQKITLEELQQFIVMLHRRGLVITGATGQGRQLKKRFDERWRQELIGKFTNVLAIRFRGIDPDRLLTWMDGWLGWMFSPAAVAACLLLALSAGLLVLAQFDVFQAKLPAFDQFFTLDNAMWFAIALGVSKVLHEFGHGLTCKHFGGECHEMGVMLLVLTPCLYCNVSDSWMLPSKWQRAMIGAAGMYVEIVLASICTFLWWFSEPGLFNQLCLSTMFVCSVSTVLFNGNPLLRYDGYYILSDLLEIPNMRQKAGEILKNKMAWWCLGLKQPENPFLPQRRQLLFAVYSVASVAYSWVVVFSILWFLNAMLKPYRLQVIGQLIAAMSIYGLVVVPLWRLGKFFSVPGRLEQVKKLRLLATIAVAATIVAAVVYVPLPYRVVSALEIEPHGADSVRVKSPGRLVEALVQPGETVQRGQTLAVLANPELDAKVAFVEGQIRYHESQLESLERLKLHDPTSEASIPSTREALASYRSQLAEARAELGELVLRAPRDGVVMPAPDVPKRPTGEGDLAPWFGHPLEAKNTGAFLEPSTVLCLIGDPHKMQATLVIEQSQKDFVAVGQEVDVQLDQMPTRLLSGRVDEISRKVVETTPRHLSNRAGGEVATKTDERGVETTWTPSYTASVFPLEGSPVKLTIGLTGKAKIHAGTQTLGQRAWRLLRETFNFKM